MMQNRLFKYFIILSYAEFACKVIRPCRLDNLASEEVKYMAKTKSSTRGVQTKKIVPVKGYTRSDGTKVKDHRRSTPN